MEVRISCAIAALFLHLWYVMFVNNLLSHIPRGHQSFHWLCCPLHQGLCRYEELQRKAPYSTMDAETGRWAQSPQLMVNIDLTVKLPWGRGRGTGGGSKGEQGNGETPTSGKRSNRVPGQTASPGLLSRATESPQIPFPMTDV